MTYMCPFCHHQQLKRSLCNECGFDLASNHYNAVCSKCRIKFISMEELKNHFRTCKLLVDDTQDIFGKCSCGINFYSETMFNIHFSEAHAHSSNGLSNTNITCDLCSVDTKCKNCKNNANEEHGINHDQTEHWQCHFCSSVFTEYAPYEKHIKTNICEDKELRCSKCKLKFANKYTKEKHIVENSCGNKNYTKCYFENCNVHCLRRIQLHEHIKECHGVNLQCEVRKFPSFVDFDLWKDDIGMKTMSFYSIVARTKYQRNGDVFESITYGCSFDTQKGECMKDNNKKKVKLELNKSYICTSRINVKVLPNQQVLARFCPEHNHTLSLEHLKVQKLTRSRREFLLDAFVMGASVEEVMDLLNAESKALGILTKEASLPRRFFKEVQRKFLKKHSSENDMQAVKRFVDDLKTVDGVLLYKSGSEVFNVTEELPADVFMLGLQTQQMLRMLETHSQIVYIEGIHTLERYPGYRLFNFLITEKYTSHVFPVAHFITNSLTPEHLTLLFSSMKSRVQHLDVESIVVQSDQHLEVALALLFNNKTVFINQWDLSCIDQSRKKPSTHDVFEYAVIVENKDEMDMSAEQLHSMTQETVAAADDCVLQFHRDLKYKFKRSYSMFILLNELINYSKKRYRREFDLPLEENAMPRILKQMRQRLFDYKVDYGTDEVEMSLFDESEEEEVEAMNIDVDNETLDSEIMSPVIKTESLDEYLSDSGEVKLEMDTSDNKEILKEIVADTLAAEDDSSLHVLMEYQKSIIELLEKNPLARPLVIKSVLDETKSLYQQVQACCDEITQLHLHVHKIPMNNSS